MEQGSNFLTHDLTSQVIYPGRLALDKKGEYFPLRLTSLTFNLLFNLDKVLGDFTCAVEYLQNQMRSLSK